MRRLHIQFYLAIVATLGVFVFAVAIFWQLAGNWRDETWSVSAAAQMVEILFPDSSAAPDEQQRAIDDLHNRLQMDVALYDRDATLLAASANIPRLPARRSNKAGWRMIHGGPVLVLPLADGRTLVVRHPHPPSVGWHVFVLPTSIALAFALGAYPIARRLTGRLARLQTGVEQLGRGDLAARVAVEGRDEVAALARSFNQSAERIEALVQSHKLLLANCSHELRTPLARIRLGIERLSPSDSAAHDELKRSIAELDSLIEEMLLTRRLDALGGLERTEEVDLLALAAEEAAHFEQVAEGRPMLIQGDAHLLRRMIRNLLDNARCYGGGATRIEVGTNTAGQARLIIEDGGPGIAPADLEHIFEPFYRGGRDGTPVRGFGLGLSIVRQIARAHGGDVSYEPIPGGGSRFTVIVRRE
jgi:signal transduction histidine kinase